MAAVPELVLSARQCGECTLCCKLLGIGTIGKPAGQWCPHCQPNQGCAIYEQRPQECRNFVCGWLRTPDLDERWKPSVCKFVLAHGEDDTQIKIVVDPARPDAWRKEPYHSQVKAWVQMEPDRGMKVMVAIGKRAIVILPDGEVDLGIVGDDDRVVTVRSETPFGYRFSALKLHKDDPRVRQG